MMQTISPGSASGLRTSPLSEELWVRRGALWSQIRCSVNAGARALKSRSWVQNPGDWRKDFPQVTTTGPRIEHLAARRLARRSQEPFAVTDVHGNVKAPVSEESSSIFERDSSVRVRPRSASSGAMDPPAAQQPSVMVNSLTGKMGLAVAKATLAAGLPLVPFSIIGESEKDDDMVDAEGVKVQLRYMAKRQALLDEVLSKYSDVIVVDFTVPQCVNDNAEFYIKRGVPFVMGTTGGDRVKLMDDVLKSGNYAVIAPQMGKQVVAFQAAMQIMADQFPGAFAGYKLKVTESHQSSKLDTSGTAKPIVGSFLELGLKLDVSEIEMVRDRDQQLQRMKVPEEHLLGHAFHTYEVVSPDNTVAFEFQHNVCGRSIYAEGTVDAVLFLARKIKQKAEKKVYDMIDVLREGNMR